MIVAGETCRVRKKAIGDGEYSGPYRSPYAFAKCMKMNRTTAEIALLHWLTHAPGEKTYEVKLDALWKMKTTTRRRIAREAASMAKYVRKENVQPEVVPENVPMCLWDPPTALAQTIEGLYCVKEAKIKGSQTLLTLVHGNVIDFAGDAIVNSTNEACLPGPGIDSLINVLGGEPLRRARLALPVLDFPFGRRCLTGDAKLTIAGTLNCKYVIHAVGPAFGPTGVSPTCTHARELEVLAGTYANALKRAQEKNLESLAFCILSAGIFRGGCPLPMIIDTGLKNIASNVYPALKRVFFCAFTTEEREAADLAFVGD